MLSLVLFFLFISFIYSFFFSNIFGRIGIFCISTALVFLSFCCICYYLIDVLFLSKEFIDISYVYFNWINISNLDVKWSFLLNNLTGIMSFIVLSISFFVHMYSIFYMYNDENSSKFMSYLSLFTLFMIVLVCSSNMIVLFFGWEGVGLCPFLLISFWNTRVQANKAALKAMLINRIGDFCFLLAIVIIFIIFKSLDFTVIFSLVNTYTFKKIFFCWTFVDLICLLLTISAFTKSAQLFFHGWLPDAMEAPTPVSALLHAATMVTAGVFLIIRFSYLFEHSFFCLHILIYFGSATLFIFSIVGFFQNDLKKIIAFSTCSQLGYMILACGLSGYTFSFYHLFNHAFFKALLFLTAGYIIHLLNNEQDLRNMNGLWNICPVTVTMFIIGSLSLIGFPFFSGFYSKEPIIVLAYFYENPAVYWFSLLGILFTSMYSIKIVYYLIIKKNKKWDNIHLKSNNIYKFNFYATVPLVVLTFLSIFSGSLAKDLFIGNGNNFFSGCIFSVNNEYIKFIEFVDFYIKILPFFFIICSPFVFVLYLKNFHFEKVFWYNIYLVFNKKLFIDSLLNIFIVHNFYNLAYNVFILFDKGLLEKIGPFGLIKLFYSFYSFFCKWFVNIKISSAIKFVCFGFLFFFIFSVYYFFYFK